MTDSRVGVVGAGYVGLTSAVCLAAKGFDTVCVDTDPGRLAQLAAGEAGIDEPDMEPLLRDGLRTGVLRFAGDYAELSDRDVVFVCVPTPTAADGGADLRAVDAAVADLADVLGPGATVAVKSTVPVGTTRRLSGRLSTRGIGAVANPEFLREGHAVFDFQHPDRVVIGAVADDGSAAAVGALYDGDTDAMQYTSAESAELAKYASNAFLAVKRTSVTARAGGGARAGADVADVTRCMGADPRIGAAFLMPGPGWGGSCLPKDTAALLQTGREHGVPLPEVAAARVTNDQQVDRIVGALRRAVDRPLAQLRIAALGLTFKAHTSDVRDSPAVAVCRHLQEAGAQVCAFDPRLDAIDQHGLPFATAADAYVAAKDADVIVVLTEWPEFVDLDWTSMARSAAAGAAVVDTRNLLTQNLIEDAGLSYLGNGRTGGY